MTLRLATWNILNSNRFDRLELLSRHLRNVHPDVVLLQESSPQYALALADELGMHVAVTAVDPALRDEETSVPAILSAYETSNANVQELPSDTGRAFFHVSATIHATGAEVRVGSAHLRHTPQAGRMGLDADYRAAAASRSHTGNIKDADLRISVLQRLEQLDAMLSRLDPGEPTIFGGDFNFVPDGIEYRTLASQFVDTWRSAPRLGHGATILERNPLIGDGRGLYTRQAGSVLEGSTGDLDYTLDYQFCSPGIEVGAAWTIGDPNTAETSAWPSDHLGIVADYAL